MAEQLFQIGTKALIRREDGGILLVGRTNKNTGQPQLDLPGGRVESSEKDMLTALRREVQEEINTELLGEPVLYDAVISKISIAVDNARYALALVIYRVEIAADAVLVLGDDEEILEWHSPKRAAELLSFKYPPEFCARVAAIDEGV